MLEKLAAVVFIAGGAFLLKRLGVLKREHGEVLLTKVLFYLLLPIAVFYFVASTPITAELALLPLAAALVSLVTLALSVAVVKALRTPDKTAGSLVAGVSIMNTGMMGYAVVVLLYGETAFSRVALFDFGMAFIVFTAIYFTASAFGKGRGNVLKSLKRVAAVPALWALVLGACASLAGVQLGWLEPAFKQVGAAVVPLLLVCLGLYFEPSLARKARLLAVGVLLRLGLGLVLGFAAVQLFGFTGLDRAVVLVCSVMPAGYNSILFAAKEGLDEEFAAALVSVTMVLSLLFLPLVLQLA
ncbi:MAG: AEC family transporter [Candidatus Micrarchaeota archaeon]